jgi:hypothetical protein
MMRQWPRVFSSLRHILMWDAVFTFEGVNAKVRQNAVANRVGKGASQNESARVRLSVNRI